MSFAKADIKDEIIWINAEKTRFYYNKHQFGRDREFDNGKFRYECSVESNELENVKYKQFDINLI